MSNCTSLRPCISSLQALQRPPFRCEKASPLSPHKEKSASAVVTDPPIDLAIGTTLTC